jgi:predicted RNA binding protein YcfA (HicA-like mRNA interferase family)
MGGEELSRRLRLFGYEVSRQTGSHVRLSTSLKGEHHITVPRHRPLKAGTLNKIIKDISGHLEIPRDKLIEELFGK